MRVRLFLGLALFCGLVLGTLYWSWVESRRETPPPFEIANVQILEGASSWRVPQVGLTITTKRRQGNGPPGWIVEVFDAGGRSLEYFYLLDGVTKWGEAALWLAQVEGRPALVSWQPDLPVIEVFPSPEKIPRQVTLWLLGEQVVRRGGPYPRGLMNWLPASDSARGK
jgi:hypothetical protein